MSNTFFIFGLLRVCSNERHHNTILTDQQKHALIELLAEYLPTEFHHGDCIGADEQAHAIVQKNRTSVRIIIHPPANPALRAFCQGDSYTAARDYLVGNRDIV